jgi:hypothetical protein
MSLIGVAGLAGETSLGLPGNHPIGVLSLNWSNISFLAGKRDKMKATDYKSPGPIMLPVLANPHVAPFSSFERLSG